MTGYHDPDELISPAEVAEMFHVERRTIWRWISNGTLPEPTRLNKRVARFKRAEILSIIEQRRKRA